MVIPDEEAHSIRPAVGLTKDEPFSHMEAKANTRVAATQANDT